MGIEELIHPEDAQALKVLMNIPALPKVMEKVFEYGYDEISWTENVTTNLRLSETQMPEIYNRLPPICERLGIPVPELYLEMTQVANAWTSGYKRPYIVLTLGLTRKVKGEELDAVLAHECGHILCQHVLYQTLANAVFTLGDSVADTLVGFVGNAMMKPLKQALVAWSRASELSADRVACIIAPSSALALALARVDMIPKYIVENMDLKAWARQGKDFEDMKKGSTWNKVVHWMSNSDAYHPFSPVRVYEAMKWEKTSMCQNLRQGQGSLNIKSKKLELPSASDMLFEKVNSLSKDISLSSLKSKFKFK